MSKDCCGASRCGRGNGSISHASVDTRFVSGNDILRTYRDAFVYVRDELKTYHIDCNGNPMPVFSEALFLNGYDPEAKRLKGAIVYDFEMNKAFVYDNNREFRMIKLVEDGGIL